MNSLGDFIQNQILGMKWLEALIHSLLTALGLDTSHASEEVYSSSSTM